MDWILALGGIILIGLGLIARFKPDYLWRLYSLEPRWRKDNPEQAENWIEKAKGQGYYFLAFGVISILLSVALTDN
jgi:hypothetical protein